MDNHSLVSGEHNLRVRKILEGFVSLTYCMSYGRLAEDESLMHQRILVAIIQNGMCSDDLSGIRDDVVKICDWVEQGGGVLPFTDPQTWNDLRTVRDFFNIENDMQPAFFYMRTTLDLWTAVEETR